MFAKCTVCGSRIVTDAREFLDWTFCGDECVTRFKMDLVDRLVPKEAIDALVRETFNAPCPVCDRPGTNDLYSATKVTGMLIMFSVQRQPRICCSSCGRKAKLLAALHCLFAGWWSPKAFFCNLFVLPANLIAAAFVKSPTEPSAALITAVKISMAESLAPQIAAARQEAAGADVSGAPNA